MELSQQIIPWGQSAKFTCEVRGNPQPSVMWLRNAMPLSSNHRLRLSRRALRVVSVGPEDDGIYQCMAENEVGSAQAMVQLRTARPGEPSEESASPDAGALSKGANVQIRFWSPGEHRRAVTPCSSCLHFSCLALLAPSSLIHWASSAPFFSLESLLSPRLCS